MGARKAARARIDPDRDRVIVYSTAARILCTAGCGAFAALFALTPVAFDDTADPGAWIVIPIIEGMAFLFFHYALRYALSKIELRRDGLVSRAPWRGKRFVAWRSVQHVDWVGTINDGRFRIWADDRPLVNVYRGMRGIYDLFEALKRHVPRERWAGAFAAYKSGYPLRIPPKSRSWHRRLPSSDAVFRRPTD